MSVGKLHNKTAKEVVAEALECDVSEVPFDASMKTLSKWDSFGHLSVIQLLSDYCNIEIDNETILRYQTLEEIEKLFLTKDK
jgi:acyl carrier protein